MFRIHCNSPTQKATKELGVARPHPSILSKNGPKIPRATRKISKPSEKAWPLEAARMPHLDRGRYIIGPYFNFLTNG